MSETNSKQYEKIVKSKKMKYFVFFFKTTEFIYDVSYRKFNNYKLTYISDIQMCRFVFSESMMKFLNFLNSHKKTTMT